MRARALLYPTGNDENPNKNVRAKTKEIKAQEATVGCCTEKFARVLIGIPQNSRENLRPCKAMRQGARMRHGKRNYGQSRLLEYECYRSGPIVYAAQVRMVIAWKRNKKIGNVPKTPVL
jgi:hypothetical protein